jgi:hypothetical protein
MIGPEPMIRTEADAGHHRIDFALNLTIAKRALVLVRFPEMMIMDMIDAHCR